MNERDVAEVLCKTESLSFADWWLGNKNKTLMNS
jgi:hypothetical protein